MAAANARWRRASSICAKYQLRMTSSPFCCRGIRRAELRACLAEEAESYSGLMLLAEPVDFVCDREYAQAISIVARQSKAQDSEMPRTQ
jgi:hypothetical protein